MKSTSLDENIIPHAAVCLLILNPYLIVEESYNNKAFKLEHLSEEHS